MRVWRTINEPAWGFLNALSDSIGLLEERLPGVLTKVDDSDMWISSDYSGQHKSAVFEAYTFLVTTARSLRTWNKRRLAFRREHLGDGRRLSFKALNEPVRKRALLPFLAIADGLRGNLVTFLIEKSFNSLFKKDGLVTWNDLPETFPEGTSANVVEKSLRLGNFLSLILAGLRHEKQSATWISDQDDSLENHDRRERLGEFIAYTTYGMTGWRNPAPLHFGTTLLDAPDRRLEDFAAIPDLTAGAFANLAPQISIPKQHSTVFMTQNRDDCTDWRTREIVDWSANDNVPLKRVLLRVVRDESGAMRARAECITLMRFLQTSRQQ